MKKEILSFLVLLCCIFLVTGAKIANAQEVNGLVEEGAGSIPCYSTYDSCSSEVWPGCQTSVKCSTCTEKIMKNKADKGSCNPCGCS
jgi:hypothetical protein